MSSNGCRLTIVQWLFLFVCCLSTTDRGVVVGFSGVVTRSTTLPMTSSAAKPTLFDLPTQERRWMERFQQLQGFVQKHGHCHPKTTDKHIEVKRLAQWLRNQRSFYKNRQSDNEEVRKLGCITPERIELLESVDGFVWDRRSKKWDDRYEELCQFHEEHGHCMVPHQSEYQGLATWTTQQRRRKRGLWGRELSATEENRLNDIGFPWSPNKSVWWFRYRELVEYKDKYGHCNVLHLWAENRKLGNWVTYQRRLIREYRLGLDLEFSSEGDGDISVSGLDKKRLKALRTVGLCENAPNRNR